MKTSTVLLAIHIATITGLMLAGAYAMYMTFGLWPSLGMYTAGALTTAAWTYAFSKGR